MRTICVRVLVFACLLSGSGCGLISAAADMTDTTTPVSTALYDRLQAAAVGRGWAVRRSEGVTPRPWDSFDLEVSPSKGETLVYTKNNFTGNMSYVCDGPKLDDQDACDAVANDLYAEAQR